MTDITFTLDEEDVKEFLLRQNTPNSTTSSSLENSVDKLGQIVERIDKRLEQLQTSVGSLERKSENLDTQFKKIENRFNELQTSVNSLEDKSEEFEFSIDTMKSYARAKSASGVMPKKGTLVADNTGLLSPRSSWRRERLYGK